MKHKYNCWGITNEGRYFNAQVIAEDIIEAVQICRTKRLYLQGVVKGEQVCKLFTSGIESVFEK